MKKNDDEEEEDESVNMFCSQSSSRREANIVLCHRIQREISQRPHSVCSSLPFWINQESEQTTATSMETYHFFLACDFPKLKGVYPPAISLPVSPSNCETRNNSAKRKWFALLHSYNVPTAGCMNVFSPSSLRIHCLFFVQNCNDSYRLFGYGWTVYAHRAYIFYQTELFWSYDAWLRYILHLK